jgi:threonylcarbamoyladenosine tRNA methylthiotransferase MtaB
LFRKAELLYRISHPTPVGSNEFFQINEASSEIYTERVNKIREVMPHACIGVDVIVGFPETDEHFLKPIVI